jgi:ribosome-associated toxin RatA of RatAB toxin-antitoxin module
MSARETANEILIQGDPDHIYSLAAAVEEWPTFLPHYRWVRVHGREGNRRTVEMAAWRTGIPVRWVSHQWLWPEERRITFQHIGGLSRGMKVEWRIEPVQLPVASCQLSVERHSGANTELATDPPAPRVPGQLATPPVRVSITHELRLQVPLVRTRPGQWVVGEVFVKAVAGRTLACLKRRVEGTS